MKKTFSATKRNIILLSVVLVCAVGWSGFWVVGSWQMRDTVARWVDAPEDSAWQVEHSGIALRGFPNRFDTTVAGFVLRHKDSFASWRIDPLRLLTLSYNPRRFIVVWPPVQSFISARGQPIALITQDMRASVRIADLGKVGLPSEAVLDIKGARFESPRYRAVSLERALVAVRAAGADSYDVNMTLAGLELPIGGQVHILNGNIDGRVSLNKELLHPTARLTARPTSSPIVPVRAIDIVSSNITLRGITLRTAGSLETDALGYLHGELSVQMQNYTDLPDLLAIYGVITPDMAGQVSKTLQLISALAKDKSRLSVVVKFANRKMYLGPIEVGNAPRLVVSY